ncbi:MAG TPA: winged helix-turn-helix domain-containing protein [Pyrinomonadaceae bacterium]|nr:winged helix-turn-helix domain-containing protein [Pyrinomonadaceae bacterium]
MNGENRHFYRFKSFQLNVRERQLLEGGAPVSLTPKAFDMLAVLVERAGRLVEKDELLDLVWEGAFVEEASINKIVHKLRRALGEDSGGNKFIETVTKKGYRFVAEVEEISEPAKTSADGHAALEDTHDLAGSVPQDAKSAPVLNVVSSQPELADKRAGSRRTRIAVIAAGFVIACAVGVAAWIGFGGSASSTSTKEPGGRNAAHELYVRAKVKAGSENKEETEAAIKLLEDAVGADPTFAEAHALLARTYNTMAFKFTSGEESKRFHENAEVSIEKALELDPDLAEAHFARGLILWSYSERFPHEQTIRSYKRSLALDPNSDETHHQLSMVYAHIGLLDEGEQELTRALELNPNNTLARYRVGVYKGWQGKFEEAVAVLKTVPTDTSPLLVDRSMAEMLIQVGKLNEAEALVNDYLKNYPRDEGGSFTSLQALLFAKTGKPEEAQAAIDRANEIGRGFGHFHHTAYNIASAYAVMNNPDEAVRWLENAADTGFPNYTYCSVDPNLNNIRNHPVFVAFMEKQKAQWERFKTLV